MLNYLDRNAKSFENFQHSEFKYPASFYFHSPDEICFLLNKIWSRRRKPRFISKWKPQKKKMISRRSISHILPFVCCSGLDPSHKFWISRVDKVMENSVCLKFLVDNYIKTVFPLGKQSTITLSVPPEATHTNCLL